MYEYITGRLVELLPTEAVIENGGFGYSVLISLGTFSQLQKDGEEFVKLYLYHHLREEEEAFFGFYDKNERELFVQLISVSGIGPNSARMMLSSLSADELRAAIIAQDANKLKGIKGIGLKTAQRIILELKDKVVPGSGSSTTFVAAAGDSSVRDEALSALVLLGFAKPAADKALTAVLKQDPTVSLEELIKKALKIL